jgi:hypothetical protein
MYILLFFFKNIVSRASVQAVRVHVCVCARMRECVCVHAMWLGLLRGQENISVHHKHSQTSECDGMGANQKK